MICAFSLAMTLLAGAGLDRVVRIRIHLVFHSRQTPQAPSSISTFSAPPYFRETPLTDRSVRSFVLHSFHHQRRDTDATTADMDSETAKLICQLVDDERQAASDHELALEVQGMKLEDGTLFDTASEAHRISDEQWENARALHIDIHESDGRAQKSSKSSAVSDTSETDGEAEYFEAKEGYEKLLPDTKTDKETKNLAETSRECCACTEKVGVSDTLTFACEPEAYTYCRTCLFELFKHALTNTTLFPPRCCKATIPLEICRAVLPKDLIKDFDLKVEELATPNPTFCYNADCSKFIRLSEIVADIGTCVFCTEKTCARCKGPEHEEGLCPSDPHVQLLMDAAKRSKWQQCTKCKTMVELSTGCFHMTYVSHLRILFVSHLLTVFRCLCKHDFCYLCGATWKTCTCPHMNEGQLLEAIPADLVDQPAALVIPHVLHDWERMDGGNCHGCQATYLIYVNRCTVCDRRRCWRCINSDT
jgi:E3 ubiquitin-protein ligase RNF144